ncbi:alpha-amylase family glycosyl hydrolase [Paenibacillus sambharensis]|nr:alpha-amylase family glycosyl hydrolase [Paenibacillus sambharensis]
MSRMHNGRISRSLGRKMTAACVFAAAIVLLMLLLQGCNNAVPGKQDTGKQKEQKEQKESVQQENTGPKPVGGDVQSSEVFYEIFVRSFYDSDGDGIGDLQGVIQKLDYLNDGDPSTTDDLGISGIWLMPIQPSPSYHGYDVTDYYEINPEYGTLDDFKELTAEAHKRGISIIMDLVVNHTSTEHPWFLDALASEESPYRDWYVWANAADEDGHDLSETSATGGKAWHNRGGSHYLGVFWEGMPDLNFDQPEVRQEMIKAGRFWLEAGADGFRLDAAKHIYDDLQSTGGKPEITDMNVAWWQEFRAGLEEGGHNPYLVGEIWDNSPVVIAPYLNKAFDSGFNFSLGEQLLAAAKSGSSSSAVTTLSRILGLYADSSGGAFIDAPFLTNHDLNRVMSVLEGDVNKAKMAASLLLTMPGRPFIYYGEEIGMSGSKPDEHIREPMVWYEDPSGGEGQPTWQSRMYNEGGSVSVEAQMNDEDSLFAHYRKLIHLRAADAVLRTGTIDSYSSPDSRVMTYVRELDADKRLVLNNLSADEIVIELDPAEEWGELAFSSVDGASLKDGKLKLPAYSTMVLK